MTNKQRAIITPEGYRLADTDCNGISMWAGYTSDVIHGKSFGILQRLLPPGAVVLDVGAGVGPFSARLHNAGYQVAAVERYARFQVPEVECFRLDLNGDWGTAVSPTYRQCDAAVAIEVLEHMENPFHFLRQCREVIKDGHYLLLTSPNVESVMSRWKFLLNGHLEMMDHEDHRSPITAKLMQKLCTQTGYEVVEKTFDVDLLDYSSSFAARLVKKGIKVLTNTLVRNREHLAGVSNLWLLRKLPDAERRSFDYYLNDDCIDPRLNEDAGG